jgi:hypothetical protein
MMILVAGPYRSGTNDEPELIAANMRAMNDAALALVRAGHLAVTGEAVALPLVAIAGSERIASQQYRRPCQPAPRQQLSRSSAPGPPD